MPGYCTPEDVRKALQDASLQAETGLEFVEPAIESQSKWLRQHTKRHWFDSSDVAGLFDSARTVTGLSLDVPHGPHSKDRQLFRDEHGIHYPTTHAGPYAKIRLPYHDVQSVDTLDVRQRGGGVEDWTATQAEGRGEDYYLLTESESKVSHLYIHAGTLGVYSDYDDLLTLDLTYGTDGIPETIRRAVALRAGADLVMDDDGQVGVPDSGQLVSVQSKAEEMRTTAESLLEKFMRTPVA